MENTSFLWFLIIGAVAGWLAGQISRGYGFGLLGNLVVGIIGAFLGGFLLQFMGVSAGSTLWAQLATSTFGAVILLVLLGFIKGRR